ncbi:hypothetical protein IHE44_0006054 [Lamprotornis superbus]|uniref:HORMA domain-containing protein n=1 Tax=Lamprotornis superbus TaxID=245042 RepID=A0A835P0Q5_9PASS|nr:hypothetical protein IHE44_0006054 [Lamprotornis superbus]
MEAAISDVAMLLQEAVLFPESITTEQQSLVLVKRLLAISVSCITYMRGLFPESSYGTRYLDDLCLKILREDKSCLGSLQIVKWIQGCFDALEKQYIYTNPECQLPLVKDGSWNLPGQQESSAVFNHGEFVAGLCSKDVKQASRLLLRTLYLLMQDLGPLPNDITLSMKLLYYNDVTPKDYQPPGFKEDGSPGDLLFAGDPVNLKVGSVSTNFHFIKVRVTTEKKRVRKADSNLIQKNGPTEISHQGLDCEEEEEEEETTMNHCCPVRADSIEHEGDKSDTHPGRKTEASSSCLEDTGSEKKRGIKEMDGMPCSRACQELARWNRTSFDIHVLINLLNLAFSQEEVIGPEKKRKKTSKEGEPVLVYRDHRLFNCCDVDVLNLPSHSQFTLDRKTKLHVPVVRSSAGMQKTLQLGDIDCIWVTLIATALLKLPYP